MSLYQGQSSSECGMIHAMIGNQKCVMGTRRVKRKVYKGAFQIWNHASTREDPSRVCKSVYAFALQNPTVLHVRHLISRRENKTAHGTPNCLYTFSGFYFQMPYNAMSSHLLEIYYFDDEMPAVQFGNTRYDQRPSPVDLI